MTTATIPGDSLAPRARPIWLALGLAWFAWLLFGIFPITPLEGDEQGVIQGASVLASGDLRDWDLAYLYEMQPGSYALISRLARLTHASTEDVFAVLSVGGALLFAAGGAILVQRLLEAPWPLVALAFLLSQEIWAGAYYLNTTAVGGWLAMLALLLALRPLSPRRGLAVASLLALAGWIRIDCLLISPVVAVLAGRHQRPLGATLRQVAAVAGASLALLLLLYFLSGVSPAAFLECYLSRGGDEGWGRTVRMYCIVTSGLVGLLSAAGLWLMLRQRRGTLLLVWAGGVGLSLAVYGRSLASNKYLYLATPFFILAAVFAARAALAGWRSLPPWRRSALAILAGGLLLFDTVIGVHTSSPAYRRFEPRPELLRLARGSRAGRHLDLTVGAGEFLATTDGYRLRGGTLFAPAAWHADKAELIRRLDRLAAELHTPGPSSLFVGDWLGYQLALRVLRREGFVFTGPHPPRQAYAYAGAWTNGAATVQLGYLAYTGSAYFDPRRRTANPTARRTWFLGAQPDLAELADGRHWRLSSPDCYGYVSVYQRD